MPLFATIIYGLALPFIAVGYIARAIFFFIEGGWNIATLHENNRKVPR